MHWQKLIVALDLDDKSALQRVVRVLAPRGVKFKIGLRAFTKFGPDLVRKMVGSGADVFLDLKLHDIPNTMAQAAAVIAEMGCWAFTVHIKAGEEALTAVKKEVAAVARKHKIRKPIILGVSELTSSKATPAQVMKLIDIAAAAGIDGIVCSPLEASAVKKRYGRKLAVVTPGIRGPEDAVGDQKRVMTAQRAFTAGSDFIVVGRPIISKKDYLKAAETVLSV
jgi:orotidine-5'-phosphate decarboxylase